VKEGSTCECQFFFFLILAEIRHSCHIMFLLPRSKKSHLQVILSRFIPKEKINIYAEVGNVTSKFNSVTRYSCCWL
jgi:hypothetical protein